MLTTASEAATVALVKNLTPMLLRSEWRLVNCRPMSLTGTIERVLRARLKIERIDVLDDSRRHAGHAGAASGGHYIVTVVSPDFIGKSALERHRMVYDALALEMKQGIHALALTARAPGEAL